MPIRTGCVRDIDPGCWIDVPVKYNLALASP